MIIRWPSWRRPKEDKALASQLVQEVCGAQYLRAGVACDAQQDTLLRSPTTFVQRSARRLWSVLAQLDIVVTNKLARLRSQEDG
ncbi:hypothetical protein GUJ93_ZPchr0002g26139 [Zizania palustris]|uniref:Uncharacterized protein n=1 Tax=Zizania palustris TaxID=103762 RepID=A0A8J5RZP5_ZIZPA|nr:hypothetical protein GUJ93_ZPchr0002g26139 [Zizania palustris]